MKRGQSGAPNALRGRGHRCCAWPPLGRYGRGDEPKKRGDVDGLIALLDRYDRLQAGRASNSFGGYYFEGPAYSMAQGMSVRAKAKSYGDVLRLLDHYIAEARRKHVKSQISAAELPVKHQVWKFGSPHTLVLTKTDELFRREAKARKDAAANLQWLAAASGR